MLRKFYPCLVALRFLLCVLKQYGYLHPDEFFQAPEIVAGDVLALDTVRAWEFDGGYAIRSIAMPYLTTGPPLYALRMLNYVAEYFLDVSLITTESLLCVPKLFMTTLSLVTDFSLFKICERIRVDPYLCMCLHGSSYIALVYYNRALSNTTETFLFSILLYYVIKDSHHVGQDRSNNNQIKTTSMVAVIITLGIFNRPTFLAFSLVPYCYWLGSAVGIPTYITVSRKILSSAMTSGIVSVLLVVCDSLYYKPDSFTVSMPSQISTCAWKQEGLFSFVTECIAKHVIVTPINFIKYNMQTTNLSEHGLHPLWTHVAVNTFVLFGMSALLMFHQTVKSMSRKDGNCAQTERNMLLMSFWVPLLLLSVFPHQEPRFILPLLVPVVVLTCEYYIQSGSSYIHTPRVLKVLWLIFNLLGVTFFGYLHQGGLLRGMSYLQRHATSNTGSHRHFIFYHTYMPPRYLLTIPRQHEHEVTVSDLAGSNGYVLEQTILDAIEQSGVAYVVCPGTVPLARRERSYYLELETYFSPHVSTEDPPAVAITGKGYFSVFKSFVSQFTLNIYRVRTR